MKIFLHYVAPFLVLSLFLAGAAAPVVIDARRWMPRNWWPRSLLRKK